MTNSLRPANVPAPSGYRVLVKLKDVPDKIGNLFIPGNAKDNMRHLAFVVQVMELGVICYKDEKFHGCPPWCAAGDWIMTSAYAGTRFLVDGLEYRLINDDEVQAVVPDPDAVKKAS